MFFNYVKYTQQKNSQTNLDSNFKTLCGPHLIHCLPLGRLQFLSWKGKLEGRKEGREKKRERNSLKQRQSFELLLSTVPFKVL